jgi:hypothetical protein
LEYSRARAALVVALAGALFVPGAGLAGTRPTNYEMVRDTAREACDSLAASLGAATAARSAGLRGAGASSGNFLVENTLSSALTAAGWTVSTRADTATGPVVEFDVVDLGLSYPHSYRNAWLGEKRVVREARARIFARLVGGSKVQWADQSEARRRDEVPASALPELEEKNAADYVKATLPPQRWNRLVEPVIVTGIIAGLILLFFSNQNTN